MDKKDKNIFFKLYDIFSTIFRKDIRIKTIIFLISIVLWLNINLDKSFETTISVPIVVSNIAKGNTLSNPVPKFAKVKIKGKGKSFVLMDYKQSFYFDIDLAVLKNRQHVKLTNENFNNRTSSEIELLSIFYPQYIDVVLDSLVSKKIPIVLNNHFTLAPGYVKTGTFKYYPDSIIVSGPKKKVMKISRLFTEMKIDDNLKDDYSIRLPIVLPYENSIKYSETFVRLYQKIVRKGLDKFKTLITLKNVPSEIKVMIDPIYVEVEVVGPVNELQNISEKDFEILVDFKDYDKKAKTLPIQVESNIKLPWKISDKTVKVLTL